MLGTVHRCVCLLGAVIGAGLFLAQASPVEARSYNGRELGKWDGSVYVARPQAPRKAFRKTVNSKKKLKRYAAINRASDYAPSATRKSLTGRSGGGGVRWVASAGCLNSTLRSVVHQASKFGSVTVSSTCRSKGHNARVGGAKKSQHLTGSAVDLRVHGNVGAAYAFLRSHGSIGGFKHYGGGLFHIDTGPRRTF